VSPVTLVADLEFELGSGLTADESLRRCTSGSARPTLAGFEARRPNRSPTVVVNLVRDSTSEPGVRSVAVVPRDVERKLLLNRCDTERDHNKTPRALALDSSNPTLNHRQASVLPERPETVPNAPPVAPPPKSLSDELRALVGDENLRHLSSPLGSSLEASPYRGRGRQLTINRESHDAPGEAVDNHREPPAKRPDLR
jgi:hypothetical protein